MRVIVGVVVCGLWTLFAGGASPDDTADYWRVRTRAKLSINRVLQDRETFQPDIIKTPETEAPKVEPMTFYTFDGCVPCVPVKDDIKAKKFPFPIEEWDITKREPTPGVTTVPAFRWRGEDGRMWVYPPPNAPSDQRGYPGADALIQMWRTTQERKNNAPRGSKVRGDAPPQGGLIRQASYTTSKQGWVVWAAMGKRVQAILVKA